VADVKVCKDLCKFRRFRIICHARYQPEFLVQGGDRDVYHLIGPGFLDQP
jgi:hypothetical protein